MHADLNTNDWCTPVEALEVLESRHGADTKILIADKLRDGRIRAHADLVWHSFAPSLDQAWREREEGLEDPEAEAVRNSLVDVSVWERSRYWSSDVELWRWGANRFVVTRRKNPADRTIIEGLRVFKKDVLDLAKPPSKRSGKKPNYPGYANLFCALLELERAQKLNVDTYPTKTGLQTFIINRMAEVESSKKNLDDETMKQIAGAAWDRVVKPGVITFK